MTGNSGVVHTFVSTREACSHDGLSLRDKQALLKQQLLTMDILASEEK